MVENLQPNPLDWIGSYTDHASIQHHAPPPSLSPLLSGFVTTLRKTSGKEAARAQGPFIRIVLSGTCRTSLSGAALLRSGDVRIFGPTFRSWEVSYSADAILFDIHITARGWQRLVGRPMDQATNAAIKVPRAASEPLAKTIQHMVAAKTLADQRDFAVSLVHRLDEKCRVDDTFIDTVTCWLEDPDQPAVDTLCKALGLSSRQTERLCKTYFGAPPKKLYRMHRALRAANGIVAAQSKDWRHVADLSYFDQSHFIRDFKEFMGCTPTRFKKQVMIDFAAL